MCWGLQYSLSADLVLKMLNMKNSTLCRSKNSCGVSPVSMCVLIARKSSVHVYKMITTPVTPPRNPPPPSLQTLEMQLSLVITSTMMENSPQTNPPGQYNDSVASPDPPSDGAPDLMAPTYLSRESGSSTYQEGVISGSSCQMSRREPNRI